MARTLALLLCLTADERELRRHGTAAQQLWSKRGWRVLLQLAGLRKLSAGRVAARASGGDSGDGGGGGGAGAGGEGKAGGGGGGGSGGGGSGGGGSGGDRRSSPGFDREEESVEEERLRLATRHVRPALALVSRGIAFLPCRRLLLRHFSSAAAAAAAAEAWAKAKGAAEGDGDSGGGSGGSSGSSGGARGAAVARPMLVCVEDVLAEREAAAAAAAAAVERGLVGGGRGRGRGRGTDAATVHGVDLVRKIRAALRPESK